MKVCAACKQSKELNDFHRRRASSDGLHRLCRGCNYAKVKTWKSRNPEKLKLQRRADARGLTNRHLMRRYGIGVAEYEALLVQQHGRCAVCDWTPTTRRLDVDHDHTTGAIRGLLCLNCNLAVGHMGDSPERAESIAAYLRAKTTNGEVNDN